MNSVNLILFLTIAIIVVAINVKNANAESNVIFIQDPLLYCSPQRAPDIAKENLTMLSTLGLQAPSFTKPDVKKKSKHLAKSSQTVVGNISDHLATSSQTVVRNTADHLATSSQTVVRNTSDHLAATSQTVASSSQNFDLNITMDEYCEKND